MLKSLTKYQRSYRKHKTKRRKKAKEYYKKNREKELKRHALYYRSHLKEKREKLAKADTKRFKNWESFFPKTSRCQICRKKLYFNSGDKRIAIHFDHRHEGKRVIKRSPSTWLRSHTRTPEREKLWKSCDFGILCEQCNRLLPTKNRKKIVRRIVKYVFGRTLFRD